MKKIILSWLCIAAFGSSVQADLMSNAGFEDGDFSNWSTFGGSWRTSTGGDAHSGTYGAVDDILTTTTDTWQGVYQDIPVIAGNLYRGHAYIRAVSVDTTASYFEIKYLDGSGSVLSQHQSTEVNADQAYTLAEVSSALAPANAVTARVSGVVYMSSTPADTDYHLFDDFVFTNITPPFAPLNNPGFETGTLTNWGSFGQGWRTGGGEDAHHGSWGAVNDVLTNHVDEWRGIYQTVAVMAGLNYYTGVDIRAVNVESSESWLEIQWYNSSGGFISQLNTTHVDASQSFTLSKLDNIVAPANAVTASVRGIVHMLSAPSGDTDFHVFDDFYFLRPVDLEIDMEASHDLVGANQYVTYTFVVTNNSDSVSGTFFITNDLTTNLNYISSTGGGTNSGSLVIWELDELAAGASTTLTVTAMHTNYTGSTQEFSHTVTASVSAEISDTQSSNDSAETETRTVGIPMLTTVSLSLLGLVIAYAFYRRQQSIA